MYKRNSFPIFLHNYYAQPIYYTDISKCCESLTDWRIPLRVPSLLTLSHNEVFDVVNWIQLLKASVKLAVSCPRQVNCTGN